MSVSNEKLVLVTVLVRVLVPEYVVVVLVKNSRDVVVTVLVRVSVPEYMVETLVLVTVSVSFIVE